MTIGLGARRTGLDALLGASRELWHPQPFCQSRPPWCESWPALSAELLALDDAAAEHLNNGTADAGAWLARRLPHLDGLAVLATLAALPAVAAVGIGARDHRWAWEIPGRKQEQIACFAAAARSSGQPVLDWCAGKGHLGRLLGLAWEVPVTSLDLDATLCRDGEVLARRAGVRQCFQVGDALTWAGGIRAGQHLVALHACGDLHRAALRGAVERRAGAVDIAPCCYHRGVDGAYANLSPGANLALTRDDLRLAVTETVTAAPRLARQRDRAMAWKLGFDALRRALEGDGYRRFKPVKGPWLRADFPEFCRLMAGREGLPLPAGLGFAEFEARGWQRQREVMRLSIVRHAFRRPLEVWLALDLGLFLEGAGYEVSLGTFCPRRLTPRNLLLSARR